MLDNYTRCFYQTGLLDPILRWPLWRSISPNVITLFGCLVGIAIYPLLAFHYSWLAIVALLLTGFIDTLDGSLARFYRRESPQGAALDLFCDRVVEIAILIGLYSYDLENRALPIIFMLASVLLCITSFLTVGIFSKNESEKSFYYSPGIMERAEAFGFFLLMILWPALFSFLAWLFSALVLATAVVRLWQFFNYSRLVFVKVKTEKR